jgi:RNA polymerase-binding transcription factor DksA
MNKADVASYRRQLTAHRDRLQAEVAGLGSEALRNAGEASGNLSHTPLHLADLGTDASDQVVAISLLAKGGWTLEEVCAALARLEDGTVGSCTECGREIPEERLRALPYARHCIDCARELERQAEGPGGPATADADSPAAAG